MLNGRRLNWKQISRAVSCMILIAIVRCLPRIYDLDIVRSEKGEASQGVSEVVSRCKQRFTTEYSWAIMVMTLLMEVSFCCLCLVIFTYIKSKKFFHKRETKRVNRSSGASFLRSPSEHNPGVISTNGVTGVKDDTLRDGTQRLFVLVGSAFFALFTFPYNFLQLHRAVATLTSSSDDVRSSSSSEMEHIENVLVILSSYSSSLSIFVYFFFMKGFREDLVEFLASILSLCCRCFCCSNGVETPENDFSMEISNPVDLVRSGSRRGPSSGGDGAQFAPKRSQRRDAFDEENHFSLLHQ